MSVNWESERERDKKEIYPRLNSIEPPAEETEQRERGGTGGWQRVSE